MRREKRESRQEQEQEQEDEFNERTTIQEHDEELRLERASVLPFLVTSAVRSVIPKMSS